MLGRAVGFRVRKAVSLSLVTFGVLSVTLGGIVTTPSNVAAAAPTALIYGPSVTTTSAPNPGGGNAVCSNMSLEQCYLTDAGWNVTVVTQATWGAMTRSQFSSYQLLVIGGQTCGGSVDPGNEAAFGPAITGSVLIIGTDPVFHYGNGGGHAGAGTLVTHGLAYAGALGGKTGLYYNVSCSLTNSNVLNAIESGFAMTRESNCAATIHVVASATQLIGITDAGLSNWGCSVHEYFSTWPADFVPFAIDTAAAGSAPSGYCPNPRYTSPDGTATGCPYIVGRGGGLTTGGVSLTGPGGSANTGTNQTLTVSVESAGAPVSGATVTVSCTSGPNAGATTAITTDASGNATYTYSSSAGGTDSWTASWTSPTSVTYTSSASVVWIQTKTATSMSATSTPGSTTQGSSVSLSATGLPPAATGTIIFSAQGSTLCTITVSSGGGSCSTATSLASGSYAVTATYSGDTNFQGSTASTSFAVQAITSMTASASPPSATYPSGVTLSVTGLPPTATGSVVFAANGSTLCTATVSSGGASCTTGTQNPATYSVTATYSGDTVDAGTTASTSFTVTNPAPPAVSAVNAIIPADTTYSAGVPAPTGFGPFTYAISTPPASGSASITNAGVLSFTPPPATSGVFTFAYTTTDTFTQTSAPATVTITVDPVASGPLSGSSTGPSAATVTGVGDGTGPLTCALSGTLPDAGTQGTASINPITCVITFTPVFGFSGPVSFHYTVTDGVALTSAPARVDITVNKPAAPGVTPTSAATTANTPVAFMVPTASGTQPVTYQVSTAPNASEGTASIDSGTGALTFTPATNFSGVATFAYTATDAYGTASAPATITVYVDPTVVGGSSTTTGPQAASGSAGAATGTGPFTYTLATAPADASSFTLHGDGTFSYTPNVGFTGTDSFTYTVTDGAALTSSPATWTVTTNAPVAPVGSALHLSGTANSTLSGTGAASSGVGPFTYAIAGQPSHGTASIDPSTGAITETPSSAWSGTDTFTYTMTDPYAQTSVPATVSVTVDPTEPNGSAGAIARPASLWASVPAATGTGPMTYTLDTGVADGTLAFQSDGTFAYLPNAGFSGNDTFTFHATDASGLRSTSATETITVSKPVVPTVLAATASTPVNTPVTITPPVGTGVGTLVFAISTAPAMGTATIVSATGVIIFTPAHGASGRVALQYTSTDVWSQTSLPATVTISVLPVAAPATSSIVGPNLATVTPAPPTGTGPFTFAIVGWPRSGDGTAVMDPGTGTAVYAPALGFSGPATLSYTATGPDGTVSAPAVVTIIVTKPAAPTTPPVSGSTMVNHPVTVPPGAPTGVGPFTYSITTNPAFGTVVVSGGTTRATGRSGVASVTPPSFTYTPSTDASGIVTFTYIVTDPYGTTSAAAMGTITVIPQAQSVTVNGTTGGGPLTVTPPAPAGSGPFTYTLVPSSVPPASKGQVTIDPRTGVATFTPAPGFTGAVAIQFTVTDPAGTVSTPSTITFNVEALAAGPMASSAVPAADTGTHLASREALAASLIAPGLLLLLVALAGPVSRRRRGEDAHQ